MRNWGQGDKPSWWRVIARNKYSVAADLRSAEGQQLARELIAKADILIENFRPGTLEKWNLDPAELRKTNPGLIVVRVSGYGQTGPRSEEHTSELQSLMRTPYADFCLKKKHHQ